jgi:hypothetical protein
MATPVKRVNKKIKKENDPVFHASTVPSKAGLMLAMSVLGRLASSQIEKGFMKILKRGVICY